MMNITFVDNTNNNYTTLSYNCPKENNNTFRTLMQ